MRVARTLILAGVAFGLAWGCTKSTDPGKADYWIDRLEDRQERIEAIKKLGTIGDKTAVPHVLDWLKKEGVWQADAAYSLGQLKDPSVVPDLLAGINYDVGKNPNDNVSRNASRTNAAIVRALALLSAKESADAIKKLVKNSDERVREACVRALADLGDFKNTDAIIEVMLSDEVPLVRLAAIQALGELGDPKAVPSLIQMLFIEIKDASFYEAARFALIQIGRPAVPELLKTLARGNESVEKLEMPGGSKIIEGAIEAKSASVLGSLRAPEAAEAIIGNLATLAQRAQKEGPQSAAHFAVIELTYAIGNIGGDKAAAAILPIAKDPQVDWRVAACEALTTLGDRAVAAELINLARAGDLEGRRAALIAASRLAPGSMLAAFDAVNKSADKFASAPELSQLVADERVRLGAAQECGTDSPCWVKKLDDPNARVRDRAAYELGWLRAKDTIPNLLKAAEDSDPDVRMAAVIGLGHLGGTDPAKLQVIYEKWQAKLEYGGVNQELLRLIARSKSAQRNKH